MSEAEDADAVAMSPEFDVMAAVLYVAERRDPGFLDEVIEVLEHTAAIEAVVRLRGPRRRPEIMATHTRAVVWAKAARVAINAVMGAEARRAAITGRSGKWAKRRE